MKQFTLLFFLVVLTSAGTISSIGQTSSDFDRRSATAEIVAMTAKMYPLDNLTDMTEGSLKKHLPGIRQTLQTTIFAEIDRNEKFDDALRSFKKNETVKFLDGFMVETESIFRRGLNPKGWVDEGLTAVFDTDYSDDEIKQLHTFLKGKNGKLLIAVFEEEMNAEKENREAREIPETETPEFEAAFEEFMASGVGEKFFEAYTKTLSDSLLKRTEEWGKQLLVNLEIEMESGSLGKKLDEFKQNLDKID